MYAYKFRILSDLNEDFIRDIEIRADQTFFDFHLILTESAGLSGNELASFHICDQEWAKLREITLIDMMGDGLERKEAENSLGEIFIMKDAKIRDFILEPRQRLVYEYDFLNMYTFFIELVKVTRAHEDAEYPRCTRSTGRIDRQAVKENYLLTEKDSLSQQLLDEFNDLLKDSMDFPHDQNVGFP
ncbi:MAG: hypothetical protein JW861_11950 [Bacteroidales bacterium]|nr:hypothetical protein [Bacteroidales bacterium]